MSTRNLPRINCKGTSNLFERTSSPFSINLERFKRNLKPFTRNQLISASFDQGQAAARSPPCSRGPALWLDPCCLHLEADGLPFPELWGPKRPRKRKDTCHGAGLIALYGISKAGVVYSGMSLGRPCPRSGVLKQSPSGSITYLTVLWGLRTGAT